MSRNGEINTLLGNVNSMNARKALWPVATSVEHQEALPYCRTRLPDSGSFDNVLEFLLMSGRSLPEALLMMILRLATAPEHDGKARLL